MFYKTSMLLRHKAATVAVFLAMTLMVGCVSDRASMTPVAEPEVEVPDRVITDVLTRNEPDRIDVIIQGSSLLSYMSVKQSMPLGVVLFFPEASLAEGIVPLVPDNMVVSTIETSKQKSGTNVRVLLKEDADYEVRREGNGLRLVFSKPGMLMVEDIVESDEEAVREMEGAAEISGEEVAPMESPMPMVNQVEMEGEAAILGQLDFTNGQDGSSSIMIGTSTPVTYNVKKRDDKTLYLTLHNALLPDSRKRPIITTRFNSAVNRILPVQTERMGKDALFIIELREAVPYLVTQQGNVLEVSIDPSTVPAMKEEVANLPEWKKALTAAEPMVTLREEEMGAEMDAMEEMVEAPVEEMAEDEERVTSLGYRKVYTGEKIAVDFFETDIKNVFRIIRAVSGENFAIDKDVSGQVTMTLERPIPWDQILDLVLKMNLLGMVKENGITRVATLDTLQKEEEKRLAYIQAEDNSKQLAKDLEPIRTEYILINYSNAQADIAPHIVRILTKDRGHVSVDQRTNQIILTDTEAKIAKAKEIVSHIDRVTPQVIIEARIVEASSNFTRSFGVNWNAKTKDAGTAGEGIFRSDLGGKYGYSVAMDYGVDTTNGIGINFSRLTGSTLILDAKLTALETKGTGKIVSAPKVLTLDNKKAEIKQGVEIPYQTVEDGDVDVQFKKVELRLEVTPHVTADSRIALKVLIDKNDVGSITNGVPGLITKGVETELIMNDGETIVIGGIIKSNKTFGESAFPLLSKIPVLGWLFKNRTRSEDKQELLVFLTPRVVKIDDVKI
ncbi:MAG: type IV pilus secretin PilQ [Desulfobacterales bacterium]|nr:type IV pilus secretin PilQ [Desulfobacterales bacterium]